MNENLSYLFMLLMCCRLLLLTSSELSMHIVFSNRQVSCWKEDVPFATVALTVILSSNLSFPSGMGSSSLFGRHRDAFFKYNTVAASM